MRNIMRCIILSGQLIYVHFLRKYSQIYSLSKLSLAYTVHECHILWYSRAWTTRCLWRFRSWTIRCVASRNWSAADSVRQTSTSPTSWTWTRFRTIHSTVLPTCSRIETSRAEPWAWRGSALIQVRTSSFGHFCTCFENMRSLRLTVCLNRSIFGLASTLQTSVPEQITSMSWILEKRSRVYI